METPLPTDADVDPVQLFLRGLCAYQSITIELSLCFGNGGEERQRA